jgi:fatty-acid desaturase
MHSPKHIGFWCVQFGFISITIVDKLPENSPRSFKHLQTHYDADLSWLTMPRSLMIFLGEALLWIFVGFYLSNAGYDILPFELCAWLTVIPRFFVGHAASLTNSAAHTFGSRPYTGRPDTPYPLCEATNCWWAAWLTFGEGWHSNHHAFALSARHGLLWWEIDVVYYGLCLLGHAGLVWNMRTVHDSIRLAPRYQPVSKHPAVKYAVLFPKTIAA